MQRHYSNAWLGTVRVDRTIEGLNFWQFKLLKGKLTDFIDENDKELRVFALGEGNHRGPFGLFNAGDNQHWLSETHEVTWLFNGGSLMVYIEIMIKPAA